MVQYLDRGLAFVERIALTLTALALIASALIALALIALASSCVIGLVLTKDCDTFVEELAVFDFDTNSKDLLEVYWMYWVEVMNR